MLSFQQDDLNSSKSQNVLISSYSFPPLSEPLWHQSLSQPRMNRHPHANTGQRRSQDSPSLPRGFTTIRDLLDGSVEDQKAASIVGVVKDYRAPIQTRGAGKSLTLLMARCETDNMFIDHKCILKLYDTSTENSDEGVEFNIFRKEPDMPAVEVGDVVIVSRGKAQNRNGYYSLMTSWQTEIHIYDHKQLAKCRKHASAKAALRPPPRRAKRDPDAKENEYALWVFENTDKTVLPDPEQFSQQMRQSLNVKDKFSLLRDVQEGKFADLTVQVVKQPYYEGDMISLWVCDFTENAHFFHKTSDSADWADGMPVRDGDPYGYLNRRNKPVVDENTDKWEGPMGKMSMQITCWHPHASFIYDQVHMGDWVRLRNVQIAYGHSSVNIEGKLRGDRAYPDKIYVQVLDAGADRESIDSHLKEALRRKRDFEKEHKQLHRTGEKRKANDEPPKQQNAKSKRQRQRANKMKALEAEMATKAAALDINEIVISEHQDRPVVPLSTILKQVIYSTTIANEEIHLELPFTCATYRTNVRVVDFHPASLKDFAVGRTVTPYDALSDNEASDSGSASSSPSDHSDHSQANKRWEWCFALKLEEVLPPSPKSNPPAQTWAVVDNHDAQLLLSMDATDLHLPHNAIAVDSLRERLFKLWGNLEERKTRLETKRQHHEKDPLRAPPLDMSDGEDEDGRARRVAAAENEGGAGGEPPGSQLSNRPFTCCIKQYGVKVRVKEGEAATAGEGKRWQRMFGLFGTKIRDE